MLSPSVPVVEISVVPPRAEVFSGLVVDPAPEPYTVPMDVDLPMDSLPEVILRIDSPCVSPIPLVLVH